MGVDNMNVAANSSVLASKSLETCFAFKDVMASHSLHSNNWGKNVKNCKQGLKGQRCLHIISVPLICLVTLLSRVHIINPPWSMIGRIKKKIRIRCILNPVLSFAIWSFLDSHNSHSIIQSRKAKLKKK
jgi:hypothetical protein